MAHQYQGENSNYVGDNGGNGLDASLVSASFHQQPRQVMNQSSIEQQLDLKYKAYSTATGGGGAGGPMSLAAFAQVAQSQQPQQMPPKQGSLTQLPQHSQFIYANSLRGSLDNGNPLGQKGGKFLEPCAARAPSS